MPNQAEVSAAAKPAAQLVVPAGTETLSAWVRASADGRPAYRAFRSLQRQLAALPAGRAHWPADMLWCGGLIAYMQPCCKLWAGGLCAQQPGTTQALTEDCCKGVAICIFGGNPAYHEAAQGPCRMFLVRRSCAT